LGLVKNNRKPIARATRVMRLGASIAGSYLAYQFQRPFLDGDQAKSRRQAFQSKNAKKVRNELQNLRGPMMKLGQALSMQTHALGSEWIEELSGLQMQAPPMHPTLMRAQFKGALGKYPEEIFQSFEPEPFAAASLGQVHWAVTKRGEKVAVKIQYPAIRDAIESDFNMLRTAAFPARLTGHLPDSVILETQRGILEETDYRREAANIEFFRKHLRALPFMRLPTVYPELSSDQVLTMSPVRGLRAPDFLKTKPSQELRDKLGSALMRLFFFQLFRIQALHSDPHPGNYLFDSDGTIGLVDFGCVKYLKPQVVRCYGQFWSREWLHDDQLYAEIIRVLFGHGKAASDRQIRRNMEEIARFYNEFHPLTEKCELLDLGDPNFMDALTQLAKVLVQNKFLSPDFIFLSRTESGMCNLLHILKSRVMTTSIAREFIPKN
jgi:predicted unusual protein kinase regulating ubiquinone biosynthesis (AarF/ABC1/UbiB family)